MWSYHPPRLARARPMPREHELPPLTVADVDRRDRRHAVVRPRHPLRHSTARFAYAAGQFCTFRATIGGEPVARCYSMSSSPETGDPFVVTVKRVPDGKMSNWMNDTLAAGRHDRRDAAGRAVRAARRRHPDRRLRGRQRHHAGPLDHQDRARHHGARDRAGVREPWARTASSSPTPSNAYARDPAAASRCIITSTRRRGSSTRRRARRSSADRTQADFYVCGPGPYMKVVEAGLDQRGVDPGRLFIERFDAARRGTRRQRGIGDGVGHDPARRAGSAASGTSPAIPFSRPHAARAHAAVRLPGGELRDLHGATRRGHGHDAREQRAGAPTRSSRDGS